MTDNEKLAELLFPNITKTPEDYEKIYPERGLSEGARVSRFAPSPTGFLHLGGLFAAMISKLTTRATDDGVFFLRIEDTDKKREIDDGVSAIIKGLSDFGITPDEGIMGFEKESGSYGPYQQSKRKDVYQSIAKSLVIQGMAYPCFCTEEELNGIRAEQEKAGTDIQGYFGEWARCRKLTFEQQKEKIEAGCPYTLRLRSPGQADHRIKFDDLIKGKIEMPENIQDVVLLKTDGIPTYHFAHAVDDHFMRTTHVVRGDEWISSVPKHIQLFKLLGFKPPKYGHISPIMKLDNGAKRKISKRKDPEAAVHFFAEQGYDSESVIEYLMTIAASDFEDWRRANPDKSYKDFKFNLKKMSVSGALFDSDKLNDVSKTCVSRLSGDKVYEKLTAWAKEFDGEFYKILTENPDYTKAVLSIDRDVPKPRKDIAKWSEAKDYFSYFFEPLYKNDLVLPENINAADAKTFLTKYKNVYNESDDRQQWFDKIKTIAPEIGFAAETKQYKAEPDKFKGHAGDLSTVLRIAVTGRRNTPDLCSIMQVLGHDRCISRIESAINTL